MLDVKAIIADDGSMTRENLEKMFAYNMSHAALEFHCKYINKSVDASDVYDGFEAGAEWALNFIIERTCEWLSNNKDNYIIDIEGETIVDEKIVADFKKAMEE